MIKNYLKVALRNMLKHRLYSVINITGLAIGIASCILIFLFVGNELSYDRFHARSGNLYRAYVTEDPRNRDPFSYSYTPARLAEAMETSFPEVRRSVRITTVTDVLRVDNINFSVRCHLVDADFFEMFTFPLVKGEPTTVLNDVNSAVLTERLAEKLFGRTNVLNKQFSLKLGDAFHDFIVAGVAENPPENSSIKFDLLVGYDNTKKYTSAGALNGWLSVFSETYVELEEGLGATDTEAKLHSVVNLNYPSEIAEMITLHLQPISDIHLDPDVPVGIEPISDPVYSYIFTVIALLVLAIACINFMTLSISRSAARAKEVGIRKVVGAVRGQLLRQFWGDAILMSLIALAVGILLARLFLPSFNQLALKELHLSFDLSTASMLAGLSLAVGLIAGSYPALVLSRFQPAMVIKGESIVDTKRSLAKGLTVMQFALSIFLVISTLVMAEQITYLQTKDLGFNKEQVVVLNNNSPRTESAMTVERVRNALSNHDDVIAVAGSSNRFARPWTQMGFTAPDETFKQFYQITVDHDYLATMQIELQEGRDFSRMFSTDSSEAIVINQAFADYFGWESPLGKSLPGGKFRPHRVVGVVKEFNFSSLQNEIGPLAMVIDPSILLRGTSDINTNVSPRSLNYINVRIKPDEIPATMDLLRRVWAQTVPDQPFEFSFLDADVEQQYRDEERWGRIVGYASTFAILIANLGLFGLATLTVTRRTKEIGIRKVLGAGVRNVLFMLTGEFSKLVVIANLIAWPLAFYTMRQWLQDFAYRVDISFMHFVLAATIALIVAITAVSYQSFRAAINNPIESIKYE